MRFGFPLWLFGLLLVAGPTRACELCAIYNANNASGQGSSGWLLSVAEQYIPFRTLQFNGREFEIRNPDYLDSSLTHVVPTYNFSERFGVSLNIPVVYRSFKRTELRYYPNAPSQLRVDEGNVLGLGDLALVGRWTAWQKAEMEYSVFFNILAGVKFPTGDTDRIEDEVNQAELYETLFPPHPPGHVGPPLHQDPLGHSISGVHQADISPGSGSFDGIFGATLNARWRRVFFNTQVQYYLRTEGESGYEMGDELMISGGPGGYLMVQKTSTLSLQAVAVYDTLARSELLGRKSNSTGMTAWYLGPLVAFTLGEHFSANAGFDWPLHITSNGYQNVPNYRVHGGFSFRF
jgi:hypothetical protein